jgi:hypothetical protein
MNNNQLELLNHEQEKDFYLNLYLKQYVLDLAIYIVAIHLPIVHHVVDLDC